LLDWKITNISAMQDLVHLTRRTPIELAKVGPIGHETAGLDYFPEPRNDRQLISESELRDVGPVSSKLGIICDDQGTRPTHGGEYTINIFRIALLFDLELNA
jgi:hypothetical protein